MRRAMILVFAAALVAATWAPVAAETADEASGVLEKRLGVAPAGGSVSISSHLLVTAALAKAGAATTEIEQEVPTVTFAGSDVEVELRFDTYTDANIEAAESAGLAITGRYPGVGWVTGRIAPASIPNLGSIPGLATVHPLYGATTGVGAVENQADVSMRADVARAVSGLDGSGIEIGVLSDSFDTNGTGTVSGTGCNQTISGTSSQASGDLPSSVRMLGDLGGGFGIDEGRGMAELIYDLVPGADLSFRTAFVSEADFAVGIQELADCGADIIVDDIIYFAEPMFQDGPVAQAANSVALDGIPYFSSAGNQATYGVDDFYVDVDPGSDTPDDFPPNGDNFHDFGGGDAWGAITLDPGEGIRVVAQWNEPFDGTLGGGALSDYDLHLYDGPDVSSLLASSATIQGCSLAAGQGGDPLEILDYVNTSGATNIVYLAVDQWCEGSTPSRLRLATYGATTSITALDFEAGIFTDAQQYGHAVAKNAQSVAAVFYGEIDDPSYQSPSNETNVEPFSSLGGDIPIYFNADGDPFAGAPKTRFKPEIAAADGTNTTFFGFDDPFDPDTDPNFFGTSAAAPHAAAVAALAMEHDPDMTRAEIYDLMESTAIDIESSGKDDLSGYGLVDAYNVVATCNGEPATIIGTSGDDDLTGTAGDDVIVTFEGDDIVDGAGGNDLICLGPGADVGKGGAGKDTIFGGPGGDTLRGQGGSDTLIGGSGGDTLEGGTSADTLEGGPGKDTLKGEDGADVLMGGGKNDTLKGGGKGDTVKGGSGADTLEGGSGNDAIFGGGGGDTVDAGKGDDDVEGQGGKDDIRGGNGDDVLSGGTKADTIRGESGNDTLNGGSGGDTLIGGSGTDIVNGGSGTDTCTGETTSSCEA